MVGKVCLQDLDLPPANSVITSPALPSFPLLITGLQLNSQLPHPKESVFSGQIEELIQPNMLLAHNILKHHPFYATHLCLNNFHWSHLKE